jgi:hypothetical protein
VDVNLVKEVSDKVKVQTTHIWNPILALLSKNKTKDEFRDFQIRKSNNFR